MYRALAEKYHWTWDQIANLTHYQMYWFLNDGENVDSVGFDTVEEYYKWLQSNPISNEEEMPNTGVHFER